MPERPLNPEVLWPSTPDDERRSRDALDRLLVGFQIIGFDWRYLYVNPAAARHGRQMSPRDLVGRTMMDAYPGIEQTAMFSRLRRCMQERCTDVFENEFTFADGTTGWFELRMQPLPEGLCIYSIDIHERKIEELALRQRVAELETKSLFDRVRQVMKVGRA